MSLYLKLHEQNLFSIIKRLDSLIENQNVINHISIRRYYLKEKDFALQDNKEINKEAVTVKAQFQKPFNTNTYQIAHFDCYGRKIKTETFENKRDFRRALIRYSNGKLIPMRFNKFGKFKTREKYKDLVDTLKDKFDYNNVLSYHKQRVSKKLTSNTFVSNESDIKIEVYKWLLKKNKDAVIIPEYSIGNRRADYISFDTKKINTTIVEIKSELDTFDRLEAQLKTYTSIANTVYLAIDIKQYEKLKTKDILLPIHVGVLIYDNNKSKKLFQFKKASINTFIQEQPFIQFLSYNDINNAFSGFKYSSKFTKEQKEEIIDKYVSKKIHNKFSYDILCNRHIIESDKRKELFYSDDFINSVASSKQLKINRFDVTGKYSITLSSYIKDKDILYKYFLNQEQIFLKNYEDFHEIKEYIKCNGKKMEELRKELREKDIYIRGIGFNQIELMNSLIEYKTEVIALIHSKKKLF